MTSNKKTIATTIFISAAILSAGVLSFTIVKKPGIIDSGFILSGLNEFTVKNEFISNYSSYKEENIMAARNEEIVKIKIISDLSKAQAEEYSSEQSLFFESLFDPKLPPYPEFLTNQTGCAKKFLPVPKNGEYGNYFLTYADERLTYGLCADDLIKYESGYGIFYCESSGKLFAVEYFMPVKNTRSPDFGAADNFLKSFKCL